MKTKINFLIGSSILAILMLMALQYYLVSNTYQLKKDVLIKTIKSELYFMDTDSELEAISDKSYGNLKILLEDYKKKKMSKNEFLEKFDNVNSSLKITYKKRYDSIITAKKLNTKIRYQELVTSFVLFNERGNDTIIHPKETSFLLWGDSLVKKNRFFLNSSKQESTDVSKNDTINSNDRSLHYEIKFNSYMDIPEWKTLVLKHISGFLLLTLISLITVILLFSYALISFIRQKKITAIKTDFINNITHELKTPLATLSIATKTLQNTIIQENKTALTATIKTIDRQRFRLQKIIDQVLQNALGFEQIELHKESINSTVFIQEIITDYQLKNPQTEIVLNLNSFNKTIEIDLFHMTSVLLNLLDNAVKYEGSKINIDINYKEKQFSIQIKDNGIGIAKKHVEKIFSKFYRIGNAKIHNVKGLGLGLYYVAQIIEKHQGEIEVDSIVNKGTSLIIKIPQV